VGGAAHHLIHDKAARKAAKKAAKQGHYGAQPHGKPFRRATPRRFASPTIIELRYFFRDGRLGLSRCRVGRRGRSGGPRRRGLRPGQEREKAQAQEPQRRKELLLFLLQQLRLNNSEPPHCSPSGVHLKTNG